MPNPLSPRTQVANAVRRILDVLEGYDRPLHGVILDHLQPELDLRLSEAIQELDPEFYHRECEEPLWVPASPTDDLA